MTTYNSQEIIKLQGIAGTSQEFMNLYQEGKIFFFKYKRVFQLQYSRNAGLYLIEFKQMKLDKTELPYTNRGRFVAYNTKQANDLIGREYFV